MSEIEKLTAAIDELSELADIYYCDGMTDRARTIRFAVTILRAELEREKNPLSCDGCKHHNSRAVASQMNCATCSRFKWVSDRYEPKGEKA